MRAAATAAYTRRLKAHPPNRHYLTSRRGDLCDRLPRFTRPNALSFAISALADRAAPRRANNARPRTQTLPVRVLCTVDRAAIRSLIMKISTIGESNKFKGQAERQDLLESLVLATDERNASSAFV